MNLFAQVNWFGDNKYIYFGGNRFINMRDATSCAKWLTGAIVNSSVREKSVKYRLMVKMSYRNIESNVFHLFLFLFDAKICALWTKEYENAS